MRSPAGGLGPWQVTTVSNLGPGWPLQALLGQQQGLDVCPDLFHVVLELLHVVLELVNPLVLPGFTGLDLRLEFRPYGLHLSPQEASQPENSSQRSAGLDPVCKHGGGNGHGVVLGVTRLGGSQD